MSEARALTGDEFVDAVKDVAGRVEDEQYL